MSTAVQPVLEIPVEFGGVSIGQATARLGCRIARAHLNIVAADEAFTGHRLTGKVLLGQRDDMPGQETMFDSDFEVEATFDVKGIRVTTDTIATGLTFSLNDIDIAELAKFSRGSGKLIVYSVGEIPDDAPDEHAEDRDEAPGTLKAEGPWADYPLDKLFKGAIRKSLAAAGLNTVGDLSNYTASERRLTDIDGIGPGKAEQIENRMMQFWEDNPDVEQTEAALAE